MRLKLLLDMDGVVANFVKKICEAHGRCNPYTDTDFRSDYEMLNSEVFKGMTVQEFFEPCGTPEFWETIEPTHDADEIISTILEFFEPEDVCISTAHTLQTGPCCDGKTRWLQNRYAHLNLHFTASFNRAKYFAASPWSLLLDDGERNTDRFEKEGGNTILLPRPWNRRWREEEGYDLRAELAAKVDYMKTLTRAFEQVKAQLHPS